jgi:TPR repeat protein
MVGITSQLFGQSRRALNRLGKSYSINREDARKRALFRLGERYLFGRENETKNPAKAVVYFRQAASRQFPLALTVLGFCFEFGHGVEMNFKEAEKCYIEAAELQDGLGMSRLAFLRKYGRPGVKIDRVEAEEWQAKVNAMGEGVLQWLIEASEKDNDSSCQYCLGVCYHDGVGVPKNEEHAVFCKCCVS